MRAEGVGAVALEPADQLDVVVLDPLQCPGRRELEDEQPQLSARLAVHLGEAGALGREDDRVVERLVRLGHVAPRRAAPGQPRSFSIRSSVHALRHASVAALQRDASRLDLERDVELREPAHVLRREALDARAAVRLDPHDAFALKGSQRGAKRMPREVVLAAEHLLGQRRPRLQLPAKDALAQRVGGRVDPQRGGRHELLDQAVADADRDSLGARGRLELREDALRVRANRLGREAELLRHRVGLHPVGEHLEDLALARTERAVALVEHDGRGEPGVHVELTIACGLDRADEVLGGRVLAHVALHAGLERLAQEARSAVGGEDDDGSLDLVAEAADDVAHVDARPPGVDDHDVGRVAVRHLARLLDRFRVGDDHVLERLLEYGADAGPDNRMVIHDQAARRVLRAGGHGASIPRKRMISPERSNGGLDEGEGYGLGSRRSSSRVTAPASRNAVNVSPAALRTTAPTGSPDHSGWRTRSRRPFASMSCTTSTRSSIPPSFTAVVRPRGVVRSRGLAAPAAARPGFALVRFALEVRAGFAAGFPAASALTAAVSAAFAGLSRFVLRFPGRELGRLPSTPPSSVIDSDSSSARSGYT